MFATTTCSHQASAPIAKNRDITARLAFLVLVGFGLAALVEVVQSYILIG